MITYIITVVDHQNYEDGEPETAEFTLEVPEGTPGRIVDLAMRGLLWENAYVITGTETYIRVGESR